MTLQFGAAITCTITNEAIPPTLTLIKQVNNDNGGTAGPNDFGISVGGQVVTSGVPSTLMAGVAYTITEAGRAGYRFVSDHRRRLPQRCWAARSR